MVHKATRYCLLTLKKLPKEDTREVFASRRAAGHSMTAFCDVYHDLQKGSGEGEGPLYLFHN